MRSYTIKHFHEDGVEISSEICHGLANSKRRALKVGWKLIGPINYDIPEKKYRVLVVLTGGLGGKELIAMDVDLYCGVKGGHFIGKTDRRKKRGGR